MVIFKRFTFEAAHRLPHVPVGHKCNRLHGHSFSVTVSLKGAVGTSSGWLLDFADIKTRFQPLLDQLDHCYLNEIDGLENPTSENIAVWIWQRLKPQLPQLSAITVQETESCGATYAGDQE